MCARKNEHPTIVAEKIGYSRAAGGKWANGTTPRPATIRKLADYFGCSVEDLTDKTETPAAQGDGLTDKQSLLIALFERLTEAQQDFVIAQLQGAAQSPPGRGAR